MTHVVVSIAGLPASARYRQRGAHRVNVRGDRRPRRTSSGPSRICRALRSAPCDTAPPSCSRTSGERSPHSAARSPTSIIPRSTATSTGISRTRGEWSTSIGRSSPTASSAHAIDTIVERFDTHVRPILGALPRRAIHDDLNDYNVLVDRQSCERVTLAVSGIVDFGDMVHSYAVADLAIACCVHDARRRRPAGRYRASRSRIRRRCSASRGRAAGALWSECDAALHERMHRRASAASATRQPVPRRQSGRDPADAARARSNPVRTCECGFARRGWSRAVAIG